MTWEERNARFVGEVQNWLGVEDDQRAGSETWSAWRRRTGVDSPDGSLRLPADQVIEERHPKDLIVLHHTSGASAKSTFDWWATTPSRIGTAFIVGRDGVVYEVFDPELWAYHLGIPNTRGRVDRRSIGIEIASEGALTQHDGRLYAFGVVASRTEYRGEVHREPDGWRGFRHFAEYTPAAIASVIGLVRSLATEYEVPWEFPEGENAPLDFAGIAGHCHFRDDKSDVHPGFPWERLREAGP